MNNSSEKRRIHQKLMKFMLSFELSKAKFYMGIEMMEWSGVCVVLIGFGKGSLIKIFEF